MSDILIKIISILEMVGGVFGILSTIYLAVITSFEAMFLLVAPIFLAISCLSLIAGIFLWRDTKLGRTLSIITQFIQLPKISSPALTFLFGFGFDAYIYVLSSNGSSNVGLELKVLGEYQLFINYADFPIGVGISIIATIFLLKLKVYTPKELSIATPQNDIPPTPDEYPDVGGDVKS